MSITYCHQFVLYVFDICFYMYYKSFFNLLKNKVSTGLMQPCWARNLLEGDETVLINRDLIPYHLTLSIEAYSTSSRYAPTLSVYLYECYKMNSPVQLSPRSWSRTLSAYKKSINDVSMDKPQGFYATWNKAEKDKYCYDITYMWNLMQLNSQKQRIDWQLFRGWGELGETDVDQRALTFSDEKCILGV